MLSAPFLYFFVRACVRYRTCFFCYQSDWKRLSSFIVEQCSTTGKMRQPFCLLNNYTNTSCFISGEEFRYLAKRHSKKRFSLWRWLICKRACLFSYVSLNGGYDAAARQPPRNTFEFCWYMIILLGVGTNLCLMLSQNWPKQ